MQRPIPLLLSSLLCACVVAAACDADGGGEREPTLSAIRRDIFDPRCSASVCHGGSNPARGLDLENEPFETLVNVESAEEGIVRVVPGDPDASLLYQVLLGPVGSVSKMPVGGELDDDELEQIRTWIEDGAENN